MITLLVEENRLVLRSSDGDLAPRHESQLAYWGFTEAPASGRFVGLEGQSAARLATKLTEYLTRCECPYELTAGIQELIEKEGFAVTELKAALRNGRQFKAGNLDLPDTQDFLSYLDQHLSRKLKEHQCKAALHLLAVRNGANFSVPGSGKTAVVLAVFQYLRERGEVDALFVVGPPACFGPWRTEYAEELGKIPSCETLAGGDIDERLSKYQVNRETVCDLYLTTFHTLHRDREHVQTLFEHQGIRFFFVIDEAHYIKQPDGMWANAALAVAPFAERRCILTGTPFPRSYVDAFNLFTALWPQSPPITERKRHRIAFHIQRNELRQAADILDETVAPLFYRVRKKDLGLAAQRFHEPICIPMNEYEQLVYDSILARIREVSQSEYFRDIDTILRLRRGRIMRLRQCISYAALLSSAVDEYSENLLEEAPGIADIIRHYDELEAPAKLAALVPLLEELQDRGEKVVIWSNFVRSLELIRETVNQLGMGVRLIYGGTPLETATASEELSREGIIREFVRCDSGVDVLVANPAACAESISLHKTCSHAIYYDLSYNCAQYLQSLDRIHRVGGSEEKEAHYSFLQYEDSLDQDILANLQEKAERMSRIVDQDYPIYSLDMFTEDDELEAYDRLFRNQS
jgi:SNF2 family DNA or RNA helicase